MAERVVVAMVERVRVRVVAMAERVVAAMAERVVAAMAERVEREGWWRCAHAVPMWERPTLCDYYVITM